MKPNILICGKTGAGKTSLIQAITHEGTVPEGRISHSQPCTKGFDVYETEIANYIDCEGMEPGKTLDQYAEFILKEINGRLDSEKAEQVVTSIWYCVDASGGRVQSADAELLRKFGTQKTRVIVTKSETLRTKEREQFQKALLELVAPSRIIYVSSHQQSGLETLINSVKVDAAVAYGNALAEVDAWKKRWDDYYRRLVEEWRRRVEAEADSIVRWGAGRAAAIAIIPLPLADVAPLMANEAYMVFRLGNLYGYSVGQNVLSMLGGIAGGSFAGKLLASFLPGLKIAIAAGVTYGVGKAAQAFFRSGMKLNEAELKRKFEEAKKEAKKTDWKEHQVEEED